MMMMPSARVSCRKAKLPTTLMAVCAPEIETPLQIDNGSGSVPQTGDRELLEDPTGNGAGPGILLSHSRRTTREWPQPYKPNLCGL